MIPLAAGSLTQHEVTILLLDIAILLGAARLLGELARRMHQPAVLGEILAGIILGPTVLGALWPGAFATLFAAGNVSVALGALTTLGISLFLLVAGLEVDLSTIWRQGRSALAVAIAGMGVPFALGLPLALALPVWLGIGPQVSPAIFALFIATALSISALPVIAKILLDLNLYRSDLGMVIIAAAIFNDVLGWIIFAFLLGMMGHGAGGFGIVSTVLLTVGFVVGMLTIGRWLLDWVLPSVQAHLSWPGGMIGMTLVAALFCAAFTEWIGIHAIFGAFIFGVALGDSRHLREQTRATLDDFISFFFAPLFFATIGLRVDFAANFDLTLAIIVTVIATAGKVLGCGLAARWSGFAKPEAWAIGVGMNARGAMEIILGLIALEAGVITERLFVALVVMAIVTSVFSGTFIQRLLRSRKKVSLTQFLSAGRFRPRLEGDRDSAIIQLVQAACAGTAANADIANLRVLAREQLMSSALGGGIAVPHARIEQLAAPLLAVGLAPQGIGFNARDGKPVKLVCLVLTPANDHQVHLDVLADIARHFGEERIVEKAAQARNYTEFIALLKSEGPSARGR